MQQVVAELGEVGATPHQRGDRFDRALGMGGDVGDDLLGEHVERVAQEAGGLDLAGDHALGDHRGLEQVAAVLRVQRAAARFADRVAGPPDALHAARDCAGRLDLDDEIDRTHVDAELERAGGDDAAQQAALQLVFDDDPLLACQRAVMGLDELVAGELVEVGGQSLGLAPGVAEDDGAAMGEHLGEHRRVHALPDVAHLLDRHDDIDLHLLAHAGVDDADRSAATVGAVPAEEVGDLFQRALRCRQADALRWAGRDGLEPLERQHQVGAAFGGGHRMDLVDDHRVDVDERVGGRRGEHEVQALGRGDEQIDRMTDQHLAITWRCVAGTHRHRRLVVRNAEPLGRQPDAHHRRPEVLLDVERQGPQRGDVQHPGAPLGVGRLGRAQPVDRGEERGQRLAAAGRSADQGVAAAEDRRPAIDLRLGRHRERRREPGTHRR